MTQKFKQPKPGSMLKFYQRYYIINMRLQVGILFYSILFAAFVNVSNETFRYILANDVGPFLGMSAIFWFWTANVIFLYAIVLFGFYYTNRIAGPIFNLQRHMDKLAEGGEFKPYSIRRKDYFHELLVSYNRLLEKMHEDKKI